MSKSRGNAEDEWWLDRLIWKLVNPLLTIFPNRKEAKSKESSVIKTLYGSSELCYCGSQKKYKHCCKKGNKKTGKVAIKVIKHTKKGTRVKVKVVRETRLPRRILTGSIDSGMDPTYFDG